jgi:hypothetical protein
VIPGNVLTTRGFGTIQFGLLLAAPFGFRLSMTLVKMGSDPPERRTSSTVETNGIWK